MADPLDTDMDRYNDIKHGELPAAVREAFDSLGLYFIKCVAEIARLRAENAELRAQQAGHKRAMARVLDELADLREQEDTIDKLVEGHDAD